MQIRLDIMYLKYNTFNFNLVYLDIYVSKCIWTIQILITKILSIWVVNF